MDLKLKGFFIYILITINFVFLVFHLILNSYSQ